MVHTNFGPVFERTFQLSLDLTEFGLETNAGLLRMLRSFFLAIYHSYHDMY